MTIEELSYLRDHGIIEAEAVNDEIMTRKAKEFQEKYHYWKTSKGIYKVHVYDGDKRKVVERKTEFDMVEYLKSREDGMLISNVTFQYCYEQWRKTHDMLIDINTVQKQQYDYKRYFENSSFTGKKISSIDKDCLLEFMAYQITHPTYKGKSCEGALNRRAAKSLWGYIKNSKYD